MLFQAKGSLFYGLVPLTWQFVWALDAERAFRRAVKMYISD